MNPERSTLARLHATVEGRVQGVSYRYFVIEQAQRLGLKGWVRNRHNGNVEVVAEGPRASLEQLLIALYQGPPMANVLEVEVEWLPAAGEFTTFWVRATG
jgi:acylphosphatase